MNIPIYIVVIFLALFFWFLFTSIYWKKQARDYLDTCDEWQRQSKERLLGRDFPVQRSKLIGPVIAFIGWIVTR